MSLLTIIQQHCQINALNVPTTIIGNRDTTVQQLLGLLNELVESMVDESNFQAFTLEGTFTLQPQEDQGSISTIAPNGWLWFHNETFEDRTLRRPLYGPVSDVEWQRLKAMPNPGPWYKYRIRRDRLLINPVPTAPGSLIAFEYASSYGVKAADGTLKPLFTLDTDTFVLQEKIVKKGLMYRWKRQKGLPYQADEEEYFKLLNNAIARDGTKRAHVLDDAMPCNLRPGIFVPSGNWPVS